MKKGHLSSEDMHNIASLAISTNWDNAIEFYAKQYNMSVNRLKALYDKNYRLVYPESMRTNPGRKRTVTNRWGITIHVGDSFKVRGVRAGEIFGPYTVAKIETSDAYAKAYGPRVIFEHGGSASIDDLIVSHDSYKKNPAKKKSRYYVQKPQRSKLLRYCVQKLQLGKWKTLHYFSDKDIAVKVAHGEKHLYPSSQIRVISK